MDKVKRSISILEHIVKWCNQIPELHEYFGDDYEIFKTDGPYFKSVAMNLLQIGELINHLPASLTEKYSYIPTPLI